MQHENQSFVPSVILRVQVLNETLKRDNTLSTGLVFAITNFSPQCLRRFVVFFHYYLVFLLLEKHFVVLEYPIAPHSLHVYLQTLLQPLPDNVMANTQQVEFKVL